MRRFRMRTFVLIAAVCVLLIALFVVVGPWVRGWGRDFGRASELLGVAQSNSEDLVLHLSSADPDIVMTALSVLKDRQDPAGKDKARELLNNDNEYIWLNAALYLGAVGDEQAAPYLIKALTHAAWRVHEEAADYLRTLTGQDFGADYAAWAEWWQEHGHPQVAALEPVRPEPSKDEMLPEVYYLIDGVVDPVTIRHGDATIRLVGVRLRPGADRHEALRQLGTLVLNQGVQLTPDDGPPDDASGSLSALVYWDPSGSGGDPSLDRMLRGDLPPVPLREKTLLNSYLLSSGLYELDPDSVQNEEILRTLQQGSE